MVFQIVSGPLAGKYWSWSEEINPERLSANFAPDSLALTPPARSSGTGSSSLERTRGMGSAFASPTVGTTVYAEPRCANLCDPSCGLVTYQA